MERFTATEVTSSMDLILWRHAEAHVERDGRATSTRR
jgi:hypothetical protein